MKKFSDLVKENESQQEFKWSADVHISGTVIAPSEGDAGELIDTQIASIPGLVSYVINNIEKSNEPIVENSDPAKIKSVSDLVVGNTYYVYGGLGRSEYRYVGKEGLLKKSYKFENTQEPDDDNIDPQFLTFTEKELLSQVYVPSINESQMNDQPFTKFEDLVETVYGSPFDDKVDTMEVMFLGEDDDSVAILLYDEYKSILPPIEEIIHALKDTTMSDLSDGYYDLGEFGDEAVVFLNKTEDGLETDTCFKVELKSKTSKTNESADFTTNMKSDDLVKDKIYKVYDKTANNKLVYQSVKFDGKEGDEYVFTRTNAPKTAPQVKLKDLDQKYLFTLTGGIQHMKEGAMKQFNVGNAADHETGVKIQKIIDILTPAEVYYDLEGEILSFDPSELEDPTDQAAVAELLGVQSLNENKIYKSLNLSSLSKNELNDLLKGVQKELSKKK